MISTIEQIVSLLWSLKDEFQAVPTKSDLSTDLGHCDIHSIDVDRTEFKNLASLLFLAAKAAPTIRNVR